MKIIKGGKLLEELPSEPKNFESVTKGGKVYVVIGVDERFLAAYVSKEKASEVMQSMCKAYLAGDEEFIMEE